MALFPNFPEWHRAKLDEFINDSTADPLNLRGTPASNINYALLTATLERNGVIVEQVKTEYDCAVIDQNSCLPEEGVGGVFDWLKNNAVVAVLSVVILLLIAAIIIFLLKRRRHRGGGSSPMTTPIT